MKILTRETGEEAVQKLPEWVRQGEEIYSRRYRRNYEQSHHGRFVAVSLSTEDAFLGNTAEEALQLARKAEPDNLFHLIRVGFPTAFQR
jgi:hypothetical protein